MNHLPQYKTVILPVPGIGRWRFGAGPVDLPTATQPPIPQHATFKTVKSPCTIFLFSVECPQETAEAYKAGREVLRVPHAPMQEAR